MSRYIDADALEANLQKAIEVGKTAGLSVSDLETVLYAVRQAPSIDIVRCAECVYCNIQNTKYLYAICERHGIEFKPFEDDTRTHYCAWGVKADRKTENSSEIPNNCKGE